MNILVKDPFEHDRPVPIGRDGPLDTDRDFSLEIAELALTLGLRDDHGGFDAAVRSAIVATGNDWLFRFPAERFPLPCADVACVRIRSGSDATFAYVYRADDTAPFQIATANDVGHELTDFAANFASLLGDLRSEIERLVP